MSKNADVSHWSNRQERTAVWGMRFLFFLYRQLGRIPFLIALGPVILFYWLTDRQYRNVSLDYLSRAHRYGVFPPKPTIWMTLKHLMRFADTILDKMTALSGANLEHFIQVEGENPLTAFVENRQGAVILTSHMGCMEALQAYGNQLKDTPIYILIHTKHSVTFNTVLDEINPLNRLKFIEVSDLTPGFVFQMHDAMQQGALLFIAGDRVPVHSKATVSVNFLGEPADFPIGGPILANLFHCPLVQMTCIRGQARHQGQPCYRVRFRLLSPSVKLNRQHREEDLRQLLGLFAQELEWAVKESPFDWFNFYPFWSNKG